MNLHIPTILGTGREGRSSEKAAKFIIQEAEMAGLSTELIDVRDFEFRSTGDPENPSIIENLGEKIKRADGYIIVAPEYNHGYPGQLKLLLDSFLKEYQRKPVGICGVSSGQLGGSRMVEQLRLVAIELGLTPIRPALYFPNVGNLFDEAGNLKDSAAYEIRVKKFLDEFIWYAKTLKAGREQN